MKFKPTDIEALLLILVAEGEVSRAALKVLTSSPDRDHFTEAFEAEVAALMAQANPDDAREARLRSFMAAARDRLLGRSPTNQLVH